MKLTALSNDDAVAIIFVTAREARLKGGRGVEKATAMSRFLSSIAVV